ISRIYPSGAFQRLESLLQERLQPDVNKAEIDQRIWDLFGESWAVMFTDLAGFSRSVAEFGIIHFLQILYESERIFSPCIDQHDGILLKTEGDSMLILFRQPQKALECAISMQKTAKIYNQDRPATEQILLCVGIGYGQMLAIGDQDVFGIEVNTASKLGEDTAKAWEILVTDCVAQMVTDMPNISLEKTDDILPGTPNVFKVIYQI
ncbi:MAG: adenylate/guanylate cyclase domain-containing protein, partial [Microcoleaceae cyanobacterium]